MANVQTLLASGPGVPDGDIRVGMTLRVCLTPLGQIDQAMFHSDPLPWPVHRFWPDRDPWDGEVIQIDGAWAIRSARGDNEPVWSMEAGQIRPGEYLTLRRPDGEELVFRVVQVEPG